MDITQVEDMLETTQLAIERLVEEPGESLAGFYQTVAETGLFQGINVQVTEARKEEVRNTLNRFAVNIGVEIRKRFPDNSMQVQKDLANVLDPKKVPMRAEGLHLHGRESLDSLLVKYSNLTAEDITLDPRRARQSFPQLKAIMARHRTDWSLPDMCRSVITQYKETFPDFFLLANISLTIPMSSVPCERGFSAQNRNITSKRNLSEQAVRNKMLIIHERLNDAQEADVLRRACELFQSHKHRIKVD